MGTPLARARKPHPPESGPRTLAFGTISKIITAQVEGGTNLNRNYTHDAFGNLETLGGLTPPVDSATNRLTGTAYDAAGNVTNSNGTLFQYDALGMVTKRTAANATDEWVFFYTADDERLWTFSSGRPSCHSGVQTRP